MDRRINDRTILILTFVPLLGISILFVAFGFSVFSLLTQSLNTLLLIGIFWKVSDMVKERGELQSRLTKAENELEAIKNR